MPGTRQIEDMRQAGHPHTPRLWAKHKAVQFDGRGRFARPAWFDEPPPEQMARARPGLSAGGVLNAAHARIPRAG